MRIGRILIVSTLLAAFAISDAHAEPQVCRHVRMDQIGALRPVCEAPAGNLAKVWQIIRNLPNCTDLRQQIQTCSAFPPTLKPGISVADLDVKFRPAPIVTPTPGGGSKPARPVNEGHEPVPPMHVEHANAAFRDEYQVRSDPGEDLPGCDGPGVGWIGLLATPHYRGELRTFFVGFDGGRPVRRGGANGSVPEVGEVLRFDSKDPASIYRAPVACVVGNCSTSKASGDFSVLHRIHYEVGTRGAEAWQLCIAPVTRGGNDEQH